MRRMVGSGSGVGRVWWDSQIAMKVNGNLQLKGERRWEVSPGNGRDLEKAGAQESMLVILSMTHYIGVWNLKRPSPITRQQPQWGNRNTNQPTILPTYDSLS